MVANSPGLIAGSNVLHRLLVPRHPPIALSSLSQQQTTKDKIATKRCSRPLYSSQNTGRTTDPAITTTRKPQTPSRETTHPPDTQHQKFGEEPAPATHHTHSRKCGSDPEETVQNSLEPRPDSSGPNSAPRPITSSHSRSTRPRRDAVLARSNRLRA